MTTLSGGAQYKKTLNEFTAATAALLQQKRDTNSDLKEGRVSDSLLEKRNLRLDRQKRHVQNETEHSRQEKRDRELLYERQHVIPDNISTLAFETKLKGVVRQGAVHVLNAIYAAQKNKKGSRRDSNESEDSYGSMDETNV